MEDYVYVVILEIEDKNKVYQKSMSINSDYQLTDDKLKYLVSLELEEGIFRFKILEKQMFYKGKKM